MTDSQSSETPEASQKKKSSDAEWGLAVGKEGMSKETKIGLALVVVLVCAFSVVVYKKIQDRNDLLADTSESEESEKLENGANEKSTLPAGNTPNDNPLPGHQQFVQNNQKEPGRINPGFTTEQKTSTLFEHNHTHGENNSQSPKSENPFGSENNNTANSTGQENQNQQTFNLNPNQNSQPTNGTSGQNTTGNNPFGTENKQAGTGTTKPTHQPAGYEFNPQNSTAQQQPENSQNTQQPFQRQTEQPTNGEQQMPERKENPFGSLNEPGNNSQYNPQQNTELNPVPNNNDRLGGYLLQNTGQAEAKSTTIVYPENPGNGTTQKNEQNPSFENENKKQFPPSNTENTQQNNNSFGQPSKYNPNGGTGQSNGYQPENGYKQNGHSATKKSFDQNTNNHSHETHSPGTQNSFTGNSQPVGGTHTYYTVRPGDNYWTISKKAYGAGKYFQALAQFNRSRIPDPKKMRPGMKVLTPKVEVLKASLPSLFPKNRSSQTGTTNVAGQSGFHRDSSGRPYYRISSGDTLSGIAQKHLGRASRWIQLYEMNKDRLKSSKSLTIGTNLRLPADASQIRLVRNPRRFR